MFNDPLCQKNWLNPSDWTVGQCHDYSRHPRHIRSDNGPEFIAKDLRSWLSGIGVKTAYIEPGSPWENGFCESFNGTFRDNLLDGEIFYSLQEAKVVVGEWVKHYNRVRPHSALGYRPPAPQVQIPKIIQTQPILLQWFTIEKLSLVVDLNWQQFKFKIDIELLFGITFISFWQKIAAVC